jgi:glycosyltransferase involved in cell wall biosynthesis
VAILPPGVDEALQPAAADPGVRQRWLGDNHHTLFFYLGVLAARKDLPTLLRGLALARRADPGLALLIGGVGPLEGELRALITALGLDGHAFLAGLIPPEHKAAYFNSADAFVFPSRLEGFGIAPAEAMACGRPVLAARAASLPEVIGEAGLYFEPGSPQALAEGLLILAHDPALRQRLGQAGRERVRTCFSWPRTAQQTAAAYQEVIQAAQEQRTP